MDGQGKRVASKVATAARAARPRASTASELADARAQQAAVNEILRVMADSPADVMVVLNAIAQQAAQLCRAPFARMTVVEGDILRPIAGYAVDNSPAPAAGNVPLARTSIQGRAIIERRTLHFEDIAPVVENEFPAAVENARTMGFRAVLAVPLLRGDDALGAIFLYRREPGLFSPDQVALVETFARQAAIALHSVQQFRATQDALEQQTATSEILRVINRAHDDVQPVFDTIAQSALALCAGSSSLVTTLEDGLLHIRALASTTEERADVLRGIFPRPPSRDNGATRAVLTSSVVTIEDVLADPDFATAAPSLAAGFRSVLAVPLMRDGAPIGCISVGRDVAGAFPSSQIELLQTFAAQAVIAIENVRLFTELEQRNRDLTRSLEQQTATSDILRVISRSPIDVRPVFETIADNALRLCEGIFSAVYRYDGDLIHLGALRNISPEGDAAFHRAYPCKPNRNGTTQRAILTGAIVHMPDIRLDAEYGYHDVARAAGFRSVLSVPMLRDDKPIGTITVFRDVAGAFPDEKIELLRTFADQAVIAVENVRLFTELEARNRDLTEALEQQTATSDILRVISQTPTDAQPVFETIAASALKLCGAESAIVATLDGDVIHMAATANVSEDSARRMRQRYPRPVGRGTATGRAIATRRAAIIPDAYADPEYDTDNATDQFRSAAAVPLLRDGKPIGAIGIGRMLPGRFSDGQIALLQTFADQAVIAVENVRLFNELDQRNRDLTEALEQQTATSDILRVISQSQTDVQPVFDAIARSAARLCAAEFCHVFRFDGELIHFTASHGLSETATAAVRTGYPMRPGRGSASARAVRSGKVEQIPDVFADAEYQHGGIAKIHTFRSIVAVPMLQQGKPVGAIVMAQSRVGEFPARQLELLRTFADQAVIAIENVRLFTELEVRNRDLSEALEHQTATSEILRVIARTPGDVQPVFDTIAASALKLCRATSALVTRRDGDMVAIVASANLTEEGAAAMREAFPMPIGRQSTSARALLLGKMVAIPDILEDSDYQVQTQALRAAFRRTLAMPLMHEGHAIGTITVGNPEPGRYPESQVALLQTFADQAVIAIENVRLFNELGARNRDLTEALEQQTATSDILRVISRSQTDVQPVFDTIARSVVKLCNAQLANVYTYDGTLIHLAAFVNESSEYVQAIRSVFPRPPGRDTAVGRAIQSGRVVTIPDVLHDPDYGITAQTLKGGYRGVLAVPLMRGQTAIGAIIVGASDPGPFPDSQIALLQVFADQAVIAIENVRLFNELNARNRDLTEALEQQTATSDILRVISQSQTDVQPVFDTIARAVAELCAARFANVFTYDGALIHLAASVNENQEYVAGLRSFFPRPAGRDTGVTRAIATGTVCMIEDVLEDPDYLIATASATGGFRSVLAVPLLRDGKPIGGIAVGRPVAGPFPDGQRTLLQTFADQAVIAIENVRLFNEVNARNRDLTEALEQQTATSDILRVISQSQTDAQPVFDTIVRSVLALCNAAFSGVYLIDGEKIGVAATAGMTPEARADFCRGFPRTLGPDTVSGRAALECRVVQTDDLMSDPDYAGAPGTFVGARTVLGVPLVRDGRAIGSIGVWRNEVKPFSDTQIALLQTFADQAVIAIENVRLFNELNARTEQLMRSVGELRALGEVGQAVSSTLDLGTVLSTIVSRARQLTGVQGGSIYEYHDERQEFLLHSADGLPDDLLDALRKTPMRPGEGALGRMAVTGQPVEIRDVVDERAYQSRVRGLLVQHELRSMLAVPLLRNDHLLGGLVINRKAPGAFDPQVVELLKTFAAQSAIAIENARLFREIEMKSRELETASRHKSEFLANMSHELRTPLNAIIGFSEVLSERLFGELNEKQSEYVGDISESGRHLLALINDILDLSKIEAGRMELDAAEVELGKAIAQTLSLVRERAERRGIALSCVVDERIGVVNADARKVKQVLLNLLSNALKFTPQGGRIDVRASAFADRVEVSVADTGVGIAPEDQEAVFEEFRQVGASAARAEGTGLGLAISRKFIELHGGRMWLHSIPGEGSTFTFSIPLKRA